MVGLWAALATTAWGQSHFMYIQSESGTPFYIKMNDSLISSTSSGYLILHDLKKGTYPVVIGFAKQQIPEAAFQLSMGASGDRGYTLKTVGGKLRLTDIQTQQEMQAVEVATSAGNRILPSTIAEISQHPVADQPAGEPVATQGDQTAPPADTALLATAPADQPAPPQDNPFENMLNAVTGSGQTEPAVAQPSPGATTGSPAAEQAQSANNTVAEPQENTPPAAAPQTDSNPFTDLLNPDHQADHQPAAPAVSPAAPEGEQPPAAAPAMETPATTAPDLTFIDFGDTSQKQEEPIAPASAPAIAAEDTLITTGKELRQWKREQRRATRSQEANGSSSLFDDLMSKVDTVATDSAAATSVAYPLFGNNGSRSQQPVPGLQEGGSPSDGEVVVCNEVADADYFAKVLRKTASKKSQEAMLRTATRYLSSDRCYTTAQIKQWAYQFASDDSRLAFLKAAYLHCADKENYASLASVLSAAGSQNQLKAFIH